MQSLLLYLQLARFHKPIGFLLLLWPTLIALWLANHGFPPIKLFIIFTAGTFITRAAGCVINDIWDARFDSKVERTKTRPLATQKLSHFQAIIFFTILISAGFVLLCLLNSLTFFLGVMAALLIIIYPLMKRVTYFPQIILGLAFSMGILMAFSASTYHLPPLSWILYVINVLWCVMYDTQYAITDLKDDIKIGIKSTAIYFKHPLYLIITLQFLIILNLNLLGWILKLKMIFYIAILITIILFTYQNYLINKNQSLRAFMNNQWVGFIWWLGVWMSL